MVVSLDPNLELPPVCRYVTVEIQIFNVDSSRCFGKEWISSMADLCMREQMCSLSKQVAHWPWWLAVPEQVQPGSLIAFAMCL
jgi:hypothetical protein